MFPSYVACIDAWTSFHRRLSQTKCVRCFVPRSFQGIFHLFSPYNCVRAFSQARRSGNRLGGDMDSQAAMNFTSFAS